MGSKVQRVLQRSSEFERVRRSGRRLQKCPWLVLYNLRNEKGHLRYGWTISRKVGNAVLRNRLKRWSREFFRAEVKEGFDPALDIVLFFRPQGEDFYSQLKNDRFQADLKKSVGPLLSSG